MRSDDHQAGPADPPKTNAPFGTATWAALLPVSIVAVGSTGQPIERLLTLQSAIAKAVHVATFVGRLRPRLSRPWVLRLRFR